MENVIIYPFFGVEWRNNFYFILFKFKLDLNHGRSNREKRNIYLWKIIYIECQKIKMSVNLEISIQYVLIFNLSGVFLLLVWVFLRSEIKLRERFMQYLRNI